MDVKNIFTDYFSDSAFYQPLYTHLDPTDLRVLYCLNTLVRQIMSTTSFIANILELVKLPKNKTAGFPNSVESLLDGLDILYATPRASTRRSSYMLFAQAIHSKKWNNAKYHAEKLPLGRRHRAETDIAFLTGNYQSMPNASYNLMSLGDKLWFGCVACAYKETLSAKTSHTMLNKCIVEKERIPLIIRLLTFHDSKTTKDRWLKTLTDDFPPVPNAREQFVEAASEHAVRVMSEERIVALLEHFPDLHYTYLYIMIFGNRELVDKYYNKNSVVFREAYTIFLRENPIRTHPKPFLAHLLTKICSILPEKSKERKEFIEEEFFRMHPSVIQGLKKENPKFVKDACDSFKISKTHIDHKYICEYLELFCDRHYECGVKFGQLKKDNANRLIKHLHRYPTNPDTAFLNEDDNNRLQDKIVASLAKLYEDDYENPAKISHCTDNVVKIFSGWVYNVGYPIELSKIILTKNQHIFRKDGFLDFPNVKKYRKLSVEEMITKLTKCLNERDNYLLIGDVTNVEGRDKKAKILAYALNPTNYYLKHQTIGKRTPYRR